MRYWLYKANRDGGPRTDGGDWVQDVFMKRSAQDWGGSDCTFSPESIHLIDDEMSVGDVVVAYQTDDEAVVGFCRVERIYGDPGEKRMVVLPIQRIIPGFPIHQHKHGTVLASSSAVNGPVMLRELDRAQMEELLMLSGAPRRVMQGKPKAGGYES